MTGEEDRYQVMESWKNKGNSAMITADSLRVSGNRNCTNFYRQAISHYTKALALPSSGGGRDDDEPCEPLNSLRLVCLANRAAAHLRRGNLGLALRDCSDAEALYSIAPPAAAPPTTAAPPPPSAPQNSMPTPPPLRLDQVMAKCRVRAATACLRLGRCAHARAGRTAAACSSRPTVSTQSSATRPSPASDRPRVLEPTRSPSAATRKPLK